MEILEEDKDLGTEAKVDGKYSINYMAKVLVGRNESMIKDILRQMELGYDFKLVTHDILHRTGNESEIKKYDLFNAIDENGVVRSSYVPRYAEYVNEIETNEQSEILLIKVKNTLYLVGLIMVVSLAVSMVYNFLIR